MANPLAYNDHRDEMPDDCVFKISPSQFPKFISEVHNWYRSEVLREKGFSHNTSSVIGTIVHYCAEMVAQSKDVDQTAIEEYIDSFEIKDDYNPNIVRANWLMMAETLVNDYVLDRQFLSVEQFVVALLKNGVYIGGQLDRLEGTKEDCMIVDFKTYTSKQKPKAIPQAYRYQLLTYAAALHLLGYNVTRIRLVYVNRNIEGDISEKTGKRLKSYPPEITELTETIGEQDIDFINSLLDLAVDSIKAAEEHPELVHVIFHDMRLKDAY